MHSWCLMRLAFGTCALSQANKSFRWEGQNKLTSAQVYFFQLVNCSKTYSLCFVYLLKNMGSHFCGIIIKWQSM
ncbi:hypothetical protein ACB092_08G079900 [Castanea dentata]